MKEKNENKVLLLFNKCSAVQKLFDIDNRVQNGGVGKIVAQFLGLI